MEMQFADFVTVGFNQIVNSLAKINYRWGQPADVVIRMPTGAGVARDHSILQVMKPGSHVPGLKVVYPATPMDKVCYCYQSDLMYLSIRPYIEV